MRKTSPNSTLPLAQFTLLASLKGGVASASAMMETMRAADPNGKAPAVATFYRALKRAMEAGWIELCGSTAEPGQAGRPGQSYRLTPGGRRVLRGEATRLAELVALALDDAPGTTASR
jgi:DNA-binding PadR family transcriptional regulator